MKWHSIGFWGAFRCVLVGILIAVFIGCGAERKPRSGHWKIVRRADWETRFYDVFFIDENTGWAVGNAEGNTPEETVESVIVHTADGGKTWQAQKSGVFEHPLQKVQFVDALRGWIVGEGGIILHTVDGGQTWVRQMSNTPNHLFDLQFLSPTEGWAVGDWGTALYTGDGGETWTNRAVGLGDDSLRGIYFLDSQHGWGVSYEGRTYYTRNGGAIWKRRETGTRYELSDM